MPQFKKRLVKRYYVYGDISIEAETDEQASEKLDSMITTGEIESEDELIQWEPDYHYEDFSLDIAIESCNWD